MKAVEERRWSMLVAVLALILVQPPTAIGRSEPPPASPGQPSIADGSPGDLSELDEGVVPVRFSVAGPVSPDDTELTLLVTQRSCGTEYEVNERVPAIAHVSETAADVWARVDVVVGPDGLPCDRGEIVRVQVRLAEPLADRTIRDAGGDPGKPVLVNGFDALDTGLRYSCWLGDRDGYSVADMLGPGLDISRHGITPPIRDARAVFDTGDLVEWLGSYDSAKGRLTYASAHIANGRWVVRGGDTCSPRAVMFDGIAAATWTLRGRRPRPRDRSIRIWVEERVCNGSPIEPRVQRPVIQLRRDAIVIVMATTVFPTDPPRRDSATGERFGFVDCPGMAPVPYVVDLPVAIGKRKLLDGGVFPPRERPVAERDEAGATGARVSLLAGLFLVPPPPMTSADHGCVRAPRPSFQVEPGRERWLVGTCGWFDGDRVQWKTAVVDPMSGEVVGHIEGTGGEA